MRNLKVFIAYNGAEYHGFQRQDNAVTVRDRDTMQQERIAIDDLVDYINKKLEF